MFPIPRSCFPLWIDASFLESISLRQIVFVLSWPPQCGSVKIAQSPPRILPGFLFVLTFEDVSLRLSRIMSASPAVKTGGVSFIPPPSTKGLCNAHVWTQAIIPNYCFSFQFACPAGGPADEHAIIRHSRLISGPFCWKISGRGTVSFISMRIETVNWIDSNSFRLVN